MAHRLISPSGSELVTPQPSSGGSRSLGGLDPVALLKAVAEAARELLTSDFEDGLRGALRALSEGTRMERVHVVRHDPATAATYLVAEHCASGSETSAANGHVHVLRVDHGACSEVWRSLAAGNGFEVCRSEPRLSQLGSTGDARTRSSDFVPIVVDGSLWGALGFDDCEDERVCAEHEMSILKSAAACVAAALERQARERARLSAAQARTDEANELVRLLEGVVDASRALLEGPSFEQSLRSWLEYLARTVDADHAMLGGFPSSVDAHHAAFYSHVWDKSGRLPEPQLPIPDTRDFHAWAQRLATGEITWAHRDELTDPASIRFWEENGCHPDLIFKVEAQRRVPLQRRHGAHLLRLGEAGRRGRTPLNHTGRSRVQICRRPRG